jgi:hypothetical protein
LTWRQVVRTKSTQVPPWPLVLGTAFTVALVLAGVVYALGRGSGDQVIAAVITFFGVMITAAAKNHVDTRSEQRLRLDAAMEAGRLLSPSEGTKASRAAAASGLLALADLGRSKLAVAMLLDLWASDVVSPEVAILIVDKALASGDDATAQIAAEVLCQNAHKLDPTKPAHWPTTLDTHWIPKASEKTKILLIESLIEMSTSSHPDNPSINALRAFAVRIVFIHQREPRDHFRKCIAGFAMAIMPAFTPGNDLVLDFHDGSTHIDIDTLGRVARDFDENPDTFYRDITKRRRDDLCKWAHCCRAAGIVTKAGAMAGPSCAELQMRQLARSRSGSPMLVILGRVAE